MAQLCASVQPLSGLFDKGLVGLDLTREWDSSTKLLSGWYFIGMCHFFGESSKAHTPSSGNRYLVPLSSLTSMESGFIPFVATQCRSHSLLGCVNALFLLFLLENSLLWTHCWFSAPWWLSVIGVLVITLLISMFASCTITKLQQVLDWGERGCSMPRILQIQHAFSAFSYPQHPDHAHVLCSKLQLCSFTASHSTWWLSLLKPKAIKSEKKFPSKGDNIYIKSF